MYRTQNSNQTKLSEFQKLFLQTEENSKNLHFFCLIHVGNPWASMSFLCVFLASWNRSENFTTRLFAKFGALLMLYVCEYGDKMTKIHSTLNISNFIDSFLFPEKLFDRLSSNMEVETVLQDGKQSVFHRRTTTRRYLMVFLFLSHPYVIWYINSERLLAFHANW